MSHFLVIVPAKDKEELAARLQPFHEFECTGTHDQYVVEVDETENVRKEWEEETQRHYKRGDQIFSGCETDHFYRPATKEEMRLGGHGSMGAHNGKSYRRVRPSNEEWAKAVSIATPESYDRESEKWGGEASIIVYRKTDEELSAEGYEEVQLPRSAGHSGYRTIEEFATDYYGYEVKEDGKIVNVTNPNARWNWWEIGGRYTGRLMTKAGAVGVSSGTPGLMTEPNTNPNRGDTCLVSDLDTESMRQKNIEWATKQYDLYLQLKEVKAEGKEPDRELNLELFRNDVYDGGDFSTLSRAEYIEKHGILKALGFAFVDLEGRWCERGKMGWWANVSNVNEDYDAGFWEFIKSLPPDQRIYAVDCHI